MKRIRMFGVMLIYILLFSIEIFSGTYKASENVTTGSYVEPPRDLSASINYNVGSPKYVMYVINWNGADSYSYTYPDFSYEYSYEIRVDDDVISSSTLDTTYEIMFFYESKAITHTVYVRKIRRTLDGPNQNGVSEWTAINVNVEAYHEYSLSTHIRKLEEKNFHTTKIYWEKSKEQQCQYEVLRSTRKDGEYKSIAKTTGTSYTDVNVTAGKRYYYKIGVSIDVHGQKLEEYSEIKSIKVTGKPLKPKIKVSTSKKKLKIKWGTIVDNSSWIEIYMKNGQRGYKKYKMINRTINIKKSRKKKGITGIQSSIDTLQKGVTYRFKARTCAIVNGGLLYSKWSKVKTVKRK